MLPGVLAVREEPPRGAGNQGAQSQRQDHLIAGVK
jgi:hypothetical protein